MGRRKNKKSSAKVIDVIADKKGFEEFNAGESPLNFSALSRLIVGDVTTNQDFDIYGGFGSGHKLKDVLKYLTDPYMYSNELIDLSNWLYNTSGYYKRLVLHFANMSTLNWVVNAVGLTDKSGDTIDYSSINKSVFKSKYNRIVSMVSRMSPKNEFRKIMNTVFKEGAYFGYYVGDDKSGFFRKLNPRHCEITGIMDGSFVFDFNLSAISAVDIGYYPQEIQVLYREWIENRKLGSGANGRVRLNAERAICIKADDTTLNVVPMFIFMLKDIMDLDAFKQLQKVAAEIDNYRLLVLKAPVDKSHGAVDVLQVSQDLIAKFTEIAMSVVPDHTGVLSTIMDPEFVQSKSSATDKDNVKSATNSLYRNAGTPILNNDTSVGMKYSVEADGAIVYALLRQLEQWVNRRIKLLRWNPAYCKFELEILNQTVYNKKDVTEMYRSASERSIPALMQWASSVSLTPDKIEGANYLQNTLFGFVDKWKVPKTSFTSTGENTKAGRPEDDLENLEESGIATREAEGNDADSRVSE